VLEPLFEKLALGYVLEGAEHPHELAPLVEDDLRPPAHHARLPVRPQHAVLEVVGFAPAERALYLRLD
jgi:hypothetical protein